MSHKHASVASVYHPHLTLLILTYIGAFLLPFHDNIIISATEKRKSYLFDSLLHL